MKEGLSFHWVCQEARGETSTDGKTRFANNPLESENTTLIAAALVSGFALVEPGGFRDTIEDTSQGPVRRVEWFIDGKTRGVFQTPLGTESIDFAEFRRRFESEEWCLSNSDHPIAFLRWAFRAHRQLRNRLRQLRPAALLRRGNRQVIVPPELPEPQRQTLISFLDQ